jgi:hypothetical protein
MKSKWDRVSERQNLVTALEIIDDLLNTTELNLDDMEEHTRTSIRNSCEFLDEARRHGYSTAT